MNIELVHKKSFKLIGISKMINGKEGYTQCPRFWEEGYQQKYEHLWKTMTTSNIEEEAVLENKIGTFALCIDGQEEFEYVISGEYKGGVVPEGMKIYDIAESDWVILKTNGPLPDSLQKMNTFIWTNWIKNEGKKFKFTQGLTLEYYTNGNPDSIDYESQIWLPMKKIIEQ